MTNNIWNRLFLTLAIVCSCASNLYGQRDIKSYPQLERKADLAYTKALEAYNQGDPSRALELFQYADSLNRFCWRGKIYISENAGEWIHYLETGEGTAPIDGRSIDLSAVEQFAYSISTDSTFSVEYPFASLRRFRESLKKRGLSQSCYDLSARHLELLYQYDSLLYIFDDSTATRMKELEPAARESFEFRTRMFSRESRQSDKSGWLLSGILDFYNPLRGFWNSDSLMRTLVSMPDIRPDIIEYSVYRYKESVIGAFKDEKSTTGQIDVVNRYKETFNRCLEHNYDAALFLLPDRYPYFTYASLIAQLLPVVDAFSARYPKEALPDEDYLRVLYAKRLCLGALYSLSDGVNSKQFAQQSLSVDLEALNLLKEDKGPQYAEWMKLRKDDEKTVGEKTGYYTDYYLDAIRSLPDVLDREGIYYAGDLFHELLSVKEMENEGLSLFSNLYSRIQNQTTRFNLAHQVFWRNSFQHADVDLLYNILQSVFSDVQRADSQSYDSINLLYDIACSVSALPEDKWRSFFTCFLSWGEGLDSSYQSRRALPHFIKGSLSVPSVGLAQAHIDVNNYMSIYEFWEPYIENRLKNSDCSEIYESMSSVLSYCGDERNLVFLVKSIEARHNISLSQIAQIPPAVLQDKQFLRDMGSLSYHFLNEKKALGESLFSIIDYCISRGTDEVDPDMAFQLAILARDHDRMLKYGEMALTRCKRLSIERQARTFLDTKIQDSYFLECLDYLRVTLAAWKKNPDLGVIAEQVYDCALFSKSFTLSFIRELLLELKDGKHPMTSELYSHALSLREKIQSGDASTGDYTEYYNLRDSLSSIVSRDLDLYQKISCDWRTIQKSLGKNEYAVEFVADFDIGDLDYYRRFALLYTLGSRLKHTYYALVIGKHSKNPTVIKLGIRDDNALQAGQNLYLDAAGYSSIWEPVLSSAGIPDGATIFFSPDSGLNSIGLEYLLDTEGTRMNERFKMVRLSSTKEVLQRGTKPTWSDAVLYGGIQYDVSPDAMRQNSERYASRATENNGVLADLLSSRSDNERRGISYLPGTAAEVQGIDSLLSTNSVSVKRRSAAEANEESFKALSSKAPSILHIATHGFYLSAVPKALQAKTSNDEEETYDVLMDRSGLLLAGAERAWMGYPVPEGIEDGILTASEIGLLDLSDTDLVVLSACQTGRGSITPDGVAGLQRGFKRAGAKAMLLSLWDVDDEATSLLMRSFYGRLMAGDTPRAALLSAQRAVRDYETEESEEQVFTLSLQSEDADQDRRVIHPFSDPTYWAGFVLIDAF